MVDFTVFKGSKEGNIVRGTSTREVHDDEVLVRITHSGLCGTDEHYKKADIVLGHEGAGVVELVGTAVKTLAKGDSVGWGYQHDACLDCKQCLTGFETLCKDRKMYGSADLDQGSFGSHAVWKARFLFKLPEGMSGRDAAPLQCGGATVYNALTQFGCRANHRVGVIGIGGLGHLAVLFAAAMGCEVVVFSSTDSKKEEASKLGAREFIATKGAKELQVSAPIDHLIVTTSFQPDWAQFLPIMAPNGVIYPLSVSSDDLKIPYMPILAGQLRIQGSLVASRHVHREMLEFAARHNIKPIVMEFPMTVDGITDCLKTLEDGKMRYRGVLIAQ